MNNTKSDPILDLILETNQNDTDGNIQTDDLLAYLLNGNFSNSSFSTFAPAVTATTSAVDITNSNNHINNNNNIPAPEQKDSPPTTGTSHSEEDEPTEEQLKLLPSKERRQIRNKISARNFRNRRKEYINSLEGKVAQHQAENSQLKLEVKWVRNMMEKLQDENDKLRLQLIMCKEGIQQPLSSSTTQPIISSNNSLAMGAWDPSCLNDFSSPQITSYLSHAAMPVWDLTRILPKATTNQNQIDLIRTYPLLGPALMSIVLHHTLNMTTDELLATSKITSKLPGYYPPESDNTKDTDLQNELLAKLLLTNQTKSDMQDVITEEVEGGEGEITEGKVVSQSIQYGFEDPAVTGFLAHCPLYWLQRRFCKFVISYVIVHYPQLEYPCRNYLPICQKFRKRRTTPA